MVGPQAEEQAEHRDQVKDRYQAGNVGPWPAQPGQVTAEGEHHHERRKGPRAPAMGQPLGYFIGRTLNVVAGGCPLLGDFQPQIAKFGRLLPECHRFLHRRHLTVAVRRVPRPLADPVADEVGQLIEVQRPGGPGGPGDPARGGMAGAARPGAGDRSGSA